MNGRTDNAVRNAAASLGLRAVGIVSQFVLRTVFLRVLGNEYAGVTGLFTDILNVLSLVQTGLETSMIFSLYRPLARNDVTRVSAIVAFYRRAFRVTAGFVLAAGAVCVPFLSALVGGLPAVPEDLRAVFLLYVFCTAVSCLTADRAALLKAEQRGRVVSVCGIAAQTAECIVSVWYLLTFRRFTGWLLLHVGFQLLKNVLLWLSAGRIAPQYLHGKNRLSAEDTKRLLSGFLCLTTYAVSGAAVYGTDSIFISRFLGAAQVAVVGNFTMIASSVRTCAEQAAAAVRPSVGHLAATEAPEKQRRIFSQMHFASFLAACWGSVCLFTLLNPFVGGIWLDPSYCLPPVTVALLTADFYIALMVYPVEAFRNANGLFYRGWWRPLVTAGLNLLLDALLGRLLGLNGIFLATAVSRILTQVWFDPLLVFRHAFADGRGVLRYYRDYAGKALLTAAVCGMTAFFASSVQFQGVLPAFLFRAAVCAVLPPAVLLCVYRKSGEYAALKRTGRDYMKRLLKK